MTYQNMIKSCPNFERILMKSFKRSVVKKYDIVPSLRAVVYKHHVTARLPSTVGGVGALEDLGSSIARVIKKLNSHAFLHATV